MQAPVAEGHETSAVRIATGGRARATDRHTGVRGHDRSPTDSGGSAERGSRQGPVGVALGFALGLTVLLAGFGAPYLEGATWQGGPLPVIYRAAAFLGQLALIGSAPALAASVLVLAASAALRVPFSSAATERAHSVALAIGGGLALAAIQTDAAVFAESRFHLSALALAILGPRTLWFALGFFAVDLVLCSLLARAARRVVASPWVRRTQIVAAAVLAVCLLTAHAAHAIADVLYFAPITSFTQRLPLFRPMTSKHLLARLLGTVDLEQARRDALAGRLALESEGLLDYPKRPISLLLPERRLSVLLIGLDAMRADALNERVTPNLARAASRAIRFEQHWSGGNGTRPGLFSLFYGLPATYWHAFYAAQRPPVLIESFQRAGYDVRVFPSNPADRLVGLERTAFRSVPELPTTVGDEAVTTGFESFLASRDVDTPFFAFLFYESAPGGCGPERPRVSSTPTDAPGDAGLRACYETALHFADAQAGRALAALHAAGLDDRTVVLLTSDHGEEFDDLDEGFRGHGSGYSEYQLHVPLAVLWPGRVPTRVTRRTSHHDIPATLLREVLGSTNDPADYSSGTSLLAPSEVDGEGWPWLLAASYTSLAVVEPDRITVSHGTSYEVRDRSYAILEDGRAHSPALAEALAESSRFLRR